MSQEISEFNEFESKLTEFKHSYDNVLYDLTDPEQEKQAKSDRLAVGKVISSLDKAHKDLKAPLKEKTDLIDAERKRIKDDLLLVQGKIKAQIVDHDKKIQEHAEMLQAKVDHIRELAEFDGYNTPTAEEVMARINSLKEIALDDSYEYRKADAALAQSEGLLNLEALYEDRSKYESEQAELEALRKKQEVQEQKEREAQIAKDAAEKATRDAEQAASNQIAESERKEKAATAAANKAKREADEKAEQAATRERQRIEREQQAERQEADRKEAKEIAKKEKQTHRAKIHKAIKNDLICEGATEELAVKIINSIKDGEISHLVINY